MKTIKLKESIGEGNTEDFFFQLKDAVKNNWEIVLDFDEIMAMDFNLMKMVMKYGIKYRKTGSMLKIKNMSEVVRFQFLMCGLSTRGDEIVV